MTSTFDDAATVERRSARLKVLLTATDEPARVVKFPADQIARAVRRRVLVRRLGMAAAVALLLVGVGVPPVRAWIVSSARAIWNSVRPAPAPAPAPVTPAEPDAALLGAVTIPVSDVFALRVTSRQTAGAVIIETTSDTVATASVRAAGSAGELVVLPDGLRIVNEPASTANYLVRVPGSVSRITVQVGGAAPRVLKPGPGTRWTVDLGAAAAND